MVFTKPIAGKTLLGTAGRHTVLTDRAIAEGGNDRGCTSGELLLLAMASCATGSIRNSDAGRTLSEDDIRVEVALVPPKRPGARDAIRVTVYIPQGVLGASRELLEAAALAGGVCSRIALGSDVDVRCRPLEEFSPPQS